MGTGIVPPLAADAASNQGASPALAFILGLVPGVGFVYNGQYAKAVLQVVVLGGLFKLVDSPGNYLFGPLLIPLITLFFFYMPLDSLRAARRERRWAVGAVLVA